MSPEVWTAIGTIALAVLTLATVITTIIITVQDRRHADMALIAERQRSDNQRREDREERQRTEQLTEAWAVEILPKMADDSDTSQYLGVDVNNLGSWTITNVEVRFTPDGHSLIFWDKIERLREYESGAFSYHASYSKSGYAGVLTKGSGMRFWTQPIGNELLDQPFPIVRWRDRWGTCWEHRQGTVRRIAEDEAWNL